MCDSVPSWNWSRSARQYNNIWHHRVLALEQCTFPQACGVRQESIMSAADFRWCTFTFPSVLWHCSSDDRNSIQTVTNVHSNLAEGSIIDFSLLMAVNGFFQSWPPSNIRFFGPTWVSNANGISIGSAIFYIYKAAASVCVSVFGISQKWPDRLGKTMQNGPTLRKSARAMSAGVPASSPARLCNSGMGQSRVSLGAWPVAFDAGLSQMLLCNWVSLVLPLPGRVNASGTLHPCDQQTDTQTTLHVTSVATGHIYACMRCSLKILHLLSPKQSIKVLDQNNRRKQIKSVSDWL